MILSLTDKSGISLLAKDFNKNKNAPLSKKGQKSDSVGAARFELATSTSQMWRDNRATLRPENFHCQLPKVAERVGVEPTVQFNPYDDLANRSFRPLRHLSLIQFI